MSTEILDQWSKFASAGLDTIRELGDLNTRLFERATQQHLELAQASVDLSVRGAQLAGESRNYREFVSGQAALATEYGDRVLKTVRKGNEAATELRDEYSAFVEGKVREAVAPIVKATGPTSGKKAA